VAPQLVIFDLDGTLVDSLADLTAATNYALRQLQLPELSASTVRDFIGNGARELLRHSIGGAGASRFEQALSLFLEYYGGHLLDRTQTYPGIVELLDELRRCGSTLTVLTNKPLVMTQRLLDGLLIADRFAHVLGGDSLPSRKPDPSGLEHLLKLSGVSRDHAVLVGDSLVDRDTAIAAGIAFYGVAWGFGSTQLRQVGVDVVELPRQLLDMVA